MPADANKERGVVLIVDDERLSRMLMGRRLSRAGFGVTEAEDASRALEIIETGGVGVVLLDIMMPGMSGLDLLELLRRNRAPGELPVIMVSALTSPGDINRAMDLGANEYFTKPVDFDRLLVRLDHLLTPE